MLHTIQPVINQWKLDVICAFWLYKLHGSHSTTLMDTFQSQLTPIMGNLKLRVSSTTAINEMHGRWGRRYDMEVWYQRSVKQVNLYLVKFQWCKITDYQYHLRYRHHKIHNFKFLPLDADWSVQVKCREYKVFYQESKISIPKHFWSTGYSHTLRTSAYYCIHVMIIVFNMYKSKE